MSRTYGDPCGIARALDAVGERWSLLIVRELLLGPKRFTDLRAGLAHLSADVLAQRLRELEEAGVVRRAKLPPPAGSRVYELTEEGTELEPVILALGRWGSRRPFPESDVPLGVDSFVIALKTVFDPEGADDDTVIELRIAEQPFAAAVVDGRLELVRGQANDPEATVSGEAGALADVLWHGRPLGRSGLTVDGDRKALERFFELFRSPRRSTRTLAAAPQPRARRPVPPAAG